MYLFLYLSISPRTDLERSVEPRRFSLEDERETFLVLHIHTPTQRDVLQMMGLFFFCSVSLSLSFFLACFLSLSLSFVLAFSLPFFSCPFCDFLFLFSVQRPPWLQAFQVEIPMWLRSFSRSFSWISLQVIPPSSGSKERRPLCLFFSLFLFILLSSLHSLLSWFSFSQSVSIFSSNTHGTDCPCMYRQIEREKDRSEDRSVYTEDSPTLLCGLLCIRLDAVCVSHLPGFQVVCMQSVLGIE